MPSWLLGANGLIENLNSRETETMRRTLPIIFSVLFIAGTAGADELTDQIDFAKKLYEKGEYNKAVKEFGFIINEIQAKLSHQFGKNFPAPLKGWKAGKPKSQNMGMMGGGQMTTVEYRQDGGRGRIEAQIILDSPITRGISMMLNNPALMGAQGRGDREVKRVRINGEYGLLEWRESRRNGQLSVILGGGRLLLQLKGRNLEKKEFLSDMMKTWDYDAAKKTAGL